MGMVQGMVNQAAELTAAAPPAGGGFLLRNIAFLGGGQVATSALTLLWTLIVPRLLGPQGMGLILMAWSAVGILLAVAGLGLRTSLMREIAMEPRRAPRLVGTGIIIRASSVVICVALTALYIQMGHFHGQAVVVLYLAAGVAVCTLLVEPIQAAFQAIERMEYLVYADVLNKALLAGCGIALVVIGFRTTAMVALMFGAAAVVLILSLRWSRRYFRIDWRVEPSEIRTALRDGLPYWTFGLFWNLYLWIDSAMLALMTPLMVVGWYSAPTKLFGTLMVIPTILSPAWLPRLISAFKAGPDRLKAVSRIPTEQIIVLGLPLSIGAALIAGPLITLLYGPAFAPSVPVFVILCFTVLPTYFNIITNQILVAIKRQVVWTRALALAAVVNPCINFVLIHECQRRLGNGAIGAALSFLVTELVLNAIAFAVIRRYLHRESLSRVGRSALATLGMALAVYTAQRLGLAVQVAAGVLTFGALALLFRLPTVEEKRGAERLLRRYLLPKTAR
jgi:O-antigen/teichoic acid export membrane protein